MNKIEKAIADLNESYNDSDGGIGHETHELSILALQEKAEREKNEPLSLDELKLMDGKPVWIEKINERKYGIRFGYWAIVGEYHKTFNDFKLSCNNEIFNISADNYNKTWLPYRRPKGE